MQPHVIDSAPSLPGIWTRPPTNAHLFPVFSFSATKNELFEPSHSHLYPHSFGAHSAPGTHTYRRLLLLHSTRKIPPPHCTFPTNPEGTLKISSRSLSHIVLKNWGETPTNIYILSHSNSFLAHYRLFSWGLSPQIGEKDFGHLTSDFETATPSPSTSTLKSEVRSLKSNLAGTDPNQH